jgi:sulfur-oxidizing protein SoxY
MKVLVPQTDERFIKSLFLIIDNNPSPLGGWFRFDGNKNVSTLSTRIRIDEYTYVRAIVEMNDGEIYMTKRFVKASGGCSAPTPKASDLAMPLGRMKLKLPDTVVPGQSNTAQILIKHPNNSGLQIDNISLLHVPAHYVQKIKVTYNGSTVFDLVSDISLSSDPSIHFTFVPEKEGEMKVHVVDTENMKFTQNWTIKSTAKGKKSATIY